MTDTRLQQLKRAWEASGSVDDEAAYLRERVRVGDLSIERAELTAYCGSTAAERALGGPRPTDPDLRRILDREGPRVVLEAAIRIASPFLERFERERPDDLGPRHCVEAATRWWSTGEGERMALRDATWEAGTSSDNLVFEDFTLHEVAELTQRVGEMAQCLMLEDTDRALAGLKSLLGYAEQIRQEEGWRFPLDEALRAILVAA